MVALVPMPYLSRRGRALRLMWILAANAARVGAAAAGAFQDVWGWCEMFG